MNLPHIVAQTTLEPDSLRLLTLTLPTGAYRLRSPQSKGTAVIEAEGAPQASDTATPLATEPAPLGQAQAQRAPEVSFTVQAETIEPELAETVAGEVRVQARNIIGVPAQVVIERPEWPDTATTAAIVGTLQEFRDLFGKEVLAPGLQLAIQRLAFLFTDLIGSTALYGAIGQSRAFRLVQDHFVILARTIAAHDGALVKTIGDAVMATFPTSQEAVQAALAMQREIRGLPTDDLDEQVDLSHLLKIGIHEGPCIAVGTNGRLDYFGTTINVAARVQHESGGGEIMLSADVFGHPAVQELLHAAGTAVYPSEAHLRGVREPVHLYRVVPAVAAVGAGSEVSVAAATAGTTTAASGVGSVATGTVTAATS